MALNETTRRIEAEMLANMCQHAQQFLSTLSSAVTAGHETELRFEEEWVDESGYAFATAVVVAYDQRCGATDLTFTIRRDNKTTIYVNASGSYYDWMHTLARQLGGVVRYVDWQYGSFIISIEGYPLVMSAAA